MYRWRYYMELNMKYFIQVKNNMPFEKPFDQNYLIKRFGDLAINSLPESIEEFNFVLAPQVTAYQKDQTVAYERGEDGLFKNVWSCQQMTEEEILEKQNLIKTVWTNTDGFASWVFNEQLCVFEAPVAMPIDNKRYRWDESTISWVEVPAT